MTENVLAELKRYMRFGPEDEAALRAFAPLVEPELARIVDAFYARLREHPQAAAVLEGPAQIERLKGTLRAWLTSLFSGPWGDAYYEQRARIGRVHVKVGLPQRFMFGAMDLVRLGLVDSAQARVPDAAQRGTLLKALHKILDLELGIMLESYREAFVDQTQRLERLERERLQRELALSEARYDEIVEKGEALTVTCEANGRIHLFNRRCEELTGLQRAQAVGRSWFDIFSRPSDRPLLEATLAAVLAGRRMPPYEGPIGTPGGTERRVRWHFTTLPGAANPLLCGIGVDISEEHLLGVRSRRAERLAALGTMAAGLAHEIRNPLNAAHIQLTVAQRRLARGAAGDHARAALDLVDSEMKRLAGLVEDFLEFARPQPLRVMRVDLRTTAEATVAFLAPEATSRGVELLIEPGESVILSIDDEKMKQVLLNLLRNALEAIDPGGHIHVRVRTRNNDALLEVEDDGPGVPRDAPIFEPFFTTKDGGTGLGLAIVHRIVADHDGAIEVVSTPERTVFTVSLPRSPLGETTA